jgi:phage baseplate assembly protein W
LSYIAENRAFDPVTGELTFLGKGMFFPLQLNNAGGTRLAWCEMKAYTKVAHSVMQIIGTPIGSRFMLRDFGSNLHQLVFEPMDSSLVATVQSEITVPVRRWEPRIRDLSVLATINEAENKLQVEVSFTIMGLSGRGSLIFPFRNESGIGTDEVAFKLVA